MNNEENQQLAIQQFAMIWNYNAHVEHQHNYYNGKPMADDAEFEDVIDSPQTEEGEGISSEKEEIDPAVVFVERVKKIMLKAEEDNGTTKNLTARGNGGTYIYNVDGKGFSKVMDELLACHEQVIKDYLDGANVETAASIKYVAPFIGYVLDTHLYSAAKMPKNAFKEVFEVVYGKGTSATLKMSDKNPSNEATILYETAKEIMEKHKNG